jgi:hypothetical protein
MTFNIHSLGFSPEGFVGVEIELRTSDGRVTLTSVDFSEVSGLASSQAVPVPNSGQATVAIQFTQAGETLAEGEIVIQLTEATRWDVHVFRTPADPTDDCLGCEGVVTFPIAPEHQREPQDALWIAWGGLKEGEVVDMKQPGEQLISQSAGVPSSTISCELI